MKLITIIAVLGMLVITKAVLNDVYNACPYTVKVPTTDYFVPSGKRTAAGVWLRLGSFTKRLKCEWIIQHPDPTTYDINLLYFDVLLQGFSYGKLCISDRLYVYYGKKQKASQYCKKSYPPSSKLLLDDNVTISSGERGMSAPFYMNIYIEASTKGCARNWKLNNGILPLFSQNIPKPSQHCLWFLPEVQSYAILHLVFLDVKLSYSLGGGIVCSSRHDSGLWVTQWRENNETVTWSLCDSSIQYPVVVPLAESQRSLVTLHTSAFTNSGTFSAMGFLSDNDCGGSFYSERGTITAPMTVRNDGYSHNKNCVWLLQTNMAYSALKAYLVFHLFDLQHSYLCAHDYVEIFEMINATDGYSWSKKYCDESKIQAIQHSQNVVVRFVSDVSLNGNGFEMSYFRSSKECKGSPVTKVNTVYQSILKYNTTMSNQSCSWFYYSDKEFVLNLQVFLQVNLDTLHCSGDVLSIYTGPLDAAQQPAYKLCRNRSIRIKANRVLFVFETSSQNIARRFEARMLFHFELEHSSSTSSVHSTTIAPTSSEPQNQLQDIIFISVTFQRNSSVVLPTIRSKQDKDVEKSVSYLYFVIAGVVVFIVIIIVLLLCLKRRKMKNRKTTATETHSPQVTPPLDMTKRPSEVPLVETMVTTKRNSIKKSIKDRLKSTFGAHIDESSFNWQDNDDSNVIQNENVQLESRSSFSESKEESICEMYESKEENRDSQVSISSEDLEKRRQSGDNVGHTFYGEATDAKKSSKRPDSYIFHSNTIELDDEDQVSTTPVKMYSDDEEEKLKKEQPVQTSNIIIHDVVPKYDMEVKDRSLTNSIYDSMSDLDDDERKDRSSTNDLYDSMNEKELQSLKEARSSANDLYMTSQSTNPSSENIYTSSSNPLYGSSGIKAATPATELMRSVYRGLTFSSSHEDDYADLDEENYACPNLLKKEKVQENPQYAGTSDDFPDNLYASPGSYYTKDTKNPLYE